MKNITYQKYFFFAIAIVVVVLILFITNSIPASAVPSTNSTSSVRGVTEKPGEIQTEVGALNSTVQEPDVSQATTSQNGLSILESNCVRCHTNQWLMKIKKTPAEWEKTLTQMEIKGVHLSDTEKEDLIDYLVQNVEP